MAGITYDSTIFGIKAESILHSHILIINFPFDLFPNRLNRLDCVILFSYTKRGL